MRRLCPYRASQTVPAKNSQLRTLSYTIDHNYKYAYVKIGSLLSSVVVFGPESKGIISFLSFQKSSGRDISERSTSVISEGYQAPTFKKDPDPFHELLETSYFI